MGSLIPKNKNEFTNQPFEDRMYDIYREAAKGRIQSERNAGSVLLNRFLLWSILLVGTVTNVAQCKQNAALRQEIKETKQRKVTPRVPGPNEPNNKRSSSEMIYKFV